MTIGIHHVTGIAGHPQRNIDFYAGLLGMRLVKRTVNFDDPSTYHLYYGDELGRPGSLLTFFPWPGGMRGQQGVGQVATTALAVPPDALPYWTQRLTAAGIKFEGPTHRFDEQVLTFADPDHLSLELVATPRAANVPGWPDGPVPAEHAVRGIHGVTLWIDTDRGTADFLVGAMHLTDVGADVDRHRFAGNGLGIGDVVDLRRIPGPRRSMGGVGTIHHVAFRAPTAALQREHRAELERLGASVTAIVDRQYFESVYFREPGNVLFEVATDPPGFTVDEPAAQLGASLMLPPRYESRRVEIERVLPPITPPASSHSGFVL